MKILENIFSIKNIETKKVITILGIKIKFKNKYKILQMQNEELKNKLNNLDNHFKVKTENIEKLISTSNKKTIEYLICKLREHSYEKLLADYKYNGYSDEILKEFENLARSKYCWFVENNNLWLLYMQVMIENNRTDELESTSKKYMHFHNIKDIENYPVVANYFHKQGYTNELIEKSSKIFEKLKTSKGKFAELIKDKSIAVVGNGPSEVGKGHGEEIDKHDIVIRFNEFHIEGDFAKDYGIKTDVWVNYSANKDFSKFNKDIDCKLFLWTFDSLYFRENIALFNLFSVIDKEWDYFGIDTAKEIWNKYQFYYAPTTGFYLIIYLLALRKSFENIDFYGYKFLENQDSPNLHYYDNKTLDSLNYHNIGAESIFLKSLIEEMKNEQ